MQTDMNLPPINTRVSYFSTSRVWQSYIGQKHHAFLNSITHTIIQLKHTAVHNNKWSIWHKAASPQQADSSIVLPGGANVPSHQGTLAHGRAHWRHLANTIQLSAAAMRSYVKLLWACVEDTLWKICPFICSFVSLCILHSAYESLTHDPSWSAVLMARHDGRSFDSRPSRDCRQRQEYCSLCHVSWRRV